MTRDEQALTLESAAHLLCAAANIAKTMQCLSASEPMPVHHMIEAQSKIERVLASLYPNQQKLHDWPMSARSGPPLDTKAFKPYAIKVVDDGPMPSDARPVFKGGVLIGYACI